MIYPVSADGETVKRLDIYPCMRCFLAVEDVYEFDGGSCVADYGYVVVGGCW